MFPFNFQLSDDFCEDLRRKSSIGFSVAMSNGRFLCLMGSLRNHDGNGNETSLNKKFKEQKNGCARAL